MKNELFDLYRTNGRTKKDSVRLLYPRCFEPMLLMMAKHGLSIDTLRVGLDGIEMYSDPQNHLYMECGLYHDEEKYNNRKKTYQAYLHNKVKDIQTSPDGMVQIAILKNALSVHFCANDEERIIIWESERDRICHIDTQEFIDAMHCDGIWDVDLDIPILKSKNMPVAADSHLYDNCGIRFDGLYELKKKNASEYLRFFPNGKVIGMLYDSNSSMIVKDFLDEEYENYGSYTFLMGQLHFHIHYSDGPMQADYNGKVGQDVMMLEKEIRRPFHRKQIGLYRFIQIDECGKTL